MRAPLKVTNRKKGNQPKIYIGGIFSDGGEIIISPDVWGNPHFTRVPPRAPYVMRLNAAASLIAAAENVSDRAARKQMQTLAQQMVKAALPAIQARG